MIRIVLFFFSFYANLNFCEPVTKRFLRDTASWGNICGDVRTGLKWNFYRIWIVMVKALVELHPHIYMGVITYPCSSINDGTANIFQ